MFIPIVTLYSKKEYVECTSCKVKNELFNKSQLSIFTSDSYSGDFFTIASLSKRAGAFVIDILLLLIFIMLLAVFLGKNP